LGRTRAEATNHFRLNGRKLPQQERGADGNFVFVGETIFRWAAFHDVADVDVLAPERHCFDHLGEEFSRAADERLALDVFIVPRAFAHEDELGFGVSDAKNELSPRFVQMAARAFAEIGANVVERFVGHAFGCFKERGAGRDGDNR